MLFLLTINEYKNVRINELNAINEFSKGEKLCRVTLKRYVNELPLIVTATLRILLVWHSVATLHRSRVF